MSVDKMSTDNLSTDLMSTQIDMLPLLSYLAPLEDILLASLPYVNCYTVVVIYIVVW